MKYFEELKTSKGHLSSSEPVYKEEGKYIAFWVGGWEGKEKEIW
jgi:hypothetical protein